ncbi:TlpA disulfide reductase family protein [Nocardioides solisilvae]|uniref:TlpA disulfide reductase family protein n=1 Tax=Nocardioides solisilvae TaxID=1542435 RepID=UPI000D7414D1|nr:TlpA disulfide reductase family protein [Nocardioides solisilvae]
MSRLPRAVPALLTACLLLAGCSDLSATGDKGYVSGDGQVTFLDPSERGDPVELAGEGLEGEPLDLADSRGTPVVVNVWGAWCVDCRIEMPDLLEARETLGDEAAFVGINVRDNSAAQAVRFAENVGIDYPSFYSSDGRALLPFSGTIPPRAIPSTVVLDAQGRVAGSIIGRLPSALTLVDLVEDVAGAGNTGGSGAPGGAGDG